MLVKESDWPSNPKIYEINTWPWLTYLSETYNSPINLKNIPNEEFKKEIKYFDVVWLMGVWERSPDGRRIALERQDLQNEYHKALHDFGENDVVGSPYSIYYYHVNSKLGGRDGLTEFRKQLQGHGIRLILDYVPNHVSIDHMWILEKSDVFITGTLEDLMTNPNGFFSVGETVYANGRDPYFDPWTDTIQINAFSREARKKAINTLLSIAELCDGVRCDMAMLMTNEVFKNTWKEKAGAPLEKEFWKEVIPIVKEKFPHFSFIAEVYWNMEWELIQQGFDYCYDKRLYDRLAHENPDAVREHLKAEFDYQRKLVRFIENHDEPRAIEKFGEERSKAAAIIALNLPGARLIHEGQTRGYKIKLPVQLGRRPIEEENTKLLDFYKNLLKIIPGREFEKANWSLCKVEPIIIDDLSYQNIISYLWEYNDIFRLVVVNYGSSHVKAHIRLKQIKFDLEDWNFTDLLHQKNYNYKGADLDEFGLYIDLNPWDGHIFDIKKE
ncbi:MAG: alpha-amylase family glycosyl hydrolase [Candidatus Hodarchaeota archaeon]